MDFSAITKLPPQRLAMIAAGGIGAGLLWRHFSNRGTTASGGTAAVDTSKLALAENSAGNLAAAQTQQVPGTNDATRDVGQGFIPIPISKWVVMVGGLPYYADATGILGPVGGAAVTTPVGGGNPTGAPLPSNVDQSTGVWDRTGVPPGISTEPTVTYGNGGIGYDAKGNPTTLNNGVAPWLTSR